MSELVATMPFAERLGVTVEHATPEEVRGGLDWAPELCTAGGVLHGGVVMALADSVGAICAYLNLPEGATTATLESKTNFFRAVRGGRVTATAQPLHVGRSSIVVQTDVANDDHPVALVIQTQAVLT
jgi:1,4-dihydroxy-2-naphthoyl-CoA hydrolase